MRNGDTLEIPAGDCIWTNAVLSVGKAVRILGAGQGVTIIRDQNAGAARMLEFHPSLNGLLEFSDFTIVAGTNSHSEIAVGGVTTTNTTWIHDVTITNLVARGVLLQGWSLSLINNVTMHSHSAIGAPTGVDVTGRGNLSISEYGGAVDSNPSWDTIPLQAGTTNMVVVENCVFNWHPSRSGANGAIDSYNGGRFAWRYNYMVNVNVGAHGTDSGGTLRGCHSWECYGNVFSNSIGVLPFSFRGGSGNYYSNTIYQSSGTPQPYIRIDNYRSSGTNIYGGETACCSPYGPHSATNIYAGKEVVGNGYPSYDQIGRTSPTTYTPSNTIQVLRPLYQWSNTFNGVLNDLTFANGTIYTNTGPYAYIPPSSEMLVENRDYYNATIEPAYTPLVYPHPLIGSTYSLSVGTMNVNTLQKQQ